MKELQVPFNQTFHFWFFTALLIEHVVTCSSFKSSLQPVQLAALRELFQAKEGNYTALSPRELTGQVVLPQTEKADVEVKAKGEGKIEEEPNLVENEAETLSASLTALNSASDEFYDVPDTNEMMDFDLENEWSSEMSPETHTAVHINSH